MQLRPLLVRPEQAALLLGSGEVVADFVNSGWLHPVISEHRLVLYSYREIDNCVRRLECGESPKALNDTPTRPARLPKRLLAAPTGTFEEQSRGVVNVEPLLLRPDSATLFVGGGSLLEEFRRADWIQPLYDRHRLVLFSVRQLSACVARVETGEKPGAYANGSARSERPDNSSSFVAKLIRKARRTRRPMLATA